MSNSHESSILADAAALLSAARAIASERKLSNALAAARRSASSLFSVAIEERAATETVPCRPSSGALLSARPSRLHGAAQWLDVSDPDDHHRMLLASAVIPD